MKKSDLKKLALLGLASGCLLVQELDGKSACTEPGCYDLTAQINKPKKEGDPNNGNLGYHVMTEDELMLELNEKGRQLYESLDEKGKELVRLVASQRCDLTNECKGLNSCQTDKNPCAGKGECKGKGKCAIADKNLAVKLVHEKMAKKRINAQNNNQSKTQNSKK